MAPYKPQRCFVYCPNTLQDVLKVLDLILLNFCEPGRKKSKPFQDVFTYSAVRQQQEIPDSRRAKSVNKGCVSLMNQSLCGHRYRTAIKVLWILCQDTTVIGSYVFKAALLAFDNLSFPHKEELIGNLMRVIQKLGYLQRKEVSLEYMIFGIQNHVPDIPKKAKEIGLGNVKRSFKNKHVLDPLFEAYCSVLQYPECSDNKDDTQLSQAKLTAESIILQLKNIVTNPGDFDIFVLKLIKVSIFLLHLKKRLEKEEGKTVLPPDNSVSTDTPTSAFEINGKRIVDIKFFMEQLKQMNSHSPFDCTFSDMNIISEEIQGFKSGLKFKCNMCNLIKTVWTVPPGAENSINT
ncbi:hypothetical protein JTE90_013773 [Oedothorax gibbosus]|uniref:Uncharacterized protein n=1 Tax=Oedothorax gibbosus TaxID=931172 RepID=A0AAV6V0G0_9ARAC|nr:hypothetical protein JTE90_013773 [Oedothorax gibbosus]